jgi:hypothetical protein
MDNKQQTALEQFAIALYKRGLLIGNGDWMQDVLQEFKEMEKEQAIKLHYEYELYVMMNESVVMTFGQFYEQTYGGGEQ